jgi:shikimate kinase
MQRGKNIFLIGLPGCGKTTIGKSLAIAMDVPFVDSDKEIETLYGTTIREIFERHGEKEFRKAENFFLQNVGNDIKIIATGGGMPCFNNHLDLMKKKGIVIFLDCPVDIITYRLTSQEVKMRPKLGGASIGELHNIIEKLLFERQDYYKQADYFVSCQQTIPIIVSLLQQVLKAHEYGDW